MANYPGRGTHRILLHFSTQNQLQGSKEDVHFVSTFRARQGENAAISGYPIFTGLNVGSEGITFRCRIINVSNEQDEALLSILESDVFKVGLQLTSIFQPAIAPFSAMALGLTEMIAAHNRNISVQDFGLGLDFSSIPMFGRLAEGAYLAVQIPESLQPAWNWDEWVYLPAQGQVVKRSNYGEILPYNYLIFSISRYEGS